MEETDILKKNVLQIEDVKLNSKPQIFENKSELPLLSIILFCLPAFTKMAALVLLKLVLN